MKFLADIGISPKAVEFLRSLGFDAKHLDDDNLGTLPDPDILEKARIEGRILLTHDLGFGELLAANRSKLPTVIIFRLQNMKPENVNTYLKKILSQQKESLEQGAIVSVSEGQIRTRPLPI
jgi:predicted nuclease of predicted toxin-antitoxin system